MFEKKKLKALLQEYKPFLLFLAKFFVTYALLTAIYEFYLLQYVSGMHFQADGFTLLVSEQVQQLLQFFGYLAKLIPQTTEAGMLLVVEQKPIAHIVEGCNAMSVIILFVAFVIAFSGKWKTTLVFVALGSLFIHALNVIRIAFLCMALLHYPKYRDFLHDIVFPLFIYGVVFLLWILWVFKFSGHVAKK
ncbi:MAG: exosortase family protein XrtF [Flavobacterium sp.]|nr:exosortase family protein XrtF [Flavobacterium sp.]